MKKRLAPRLNLLDVDSSGSAGLKPYAEREREIVTQIVQKDGIWVNGCGMPKTYHGQFGRDVRKMIKAGKIKTVTQRAGTTYGGRPRNYKRLVLVG